MKRSFLYEGVLYLVIRYLQFSAHCFYHLYKQAVVSFLSPKKLKETSKAVAASTWEAYLNIQHYNQSSPYLIIRVPERRLRLKNSSVVVVK